MRTPVSPRAIVDALDELSDGVFAFLNRETGELVTLSSAALRDAEDDAPLDDRAGWEREDILKAREVRSSEAFLQLPTAYAINEYTIIERFCATIEGARISHEMQRLIRGSGAFRRFKDGLHRHGLAQAWYRFRAEALEQIAVEWLEAHQIPYAR